MINKKGIVVFSIFFAVILVVAVINIITIHGLKSHQMIVMKRQSIIYEKLSNLEDMISSISDELYSVKSNIEDIEYIVDDILDEVRR